MPERYKGFGYWDIATRQMSIVTRWRNHSYACTYGTWRLNNNRQGCI